MEEKAPLRKNYSLPNNLVVAIAKGVRGAAAEGGSSLASFALNGLLTLGM
ncbi:hypothetical protein GCM10023155_44040 [Bremerella cremea]